MADSERDTTRHQVCKPGETTHGDWSPQRLRAMDEKFRKRVEKAVRNGSEHDPGRNRKPRP